MLGKPSVWWALLPGGGHYLDNEADVQSGAQGFPTSNYRHIGRAASASPRSSSVNGHFMKLPWFILFSILLNHQTFVP